jgi:molecular chaperone GrpE
MPSADTPVPATPELSVVATRSLSELEQLATQAGQFREGWARAQADLENFRKRAAREKEDLRRFAIEAFVDSLLPVVDSFELGVESAATAPDPSTIAEGMRMALGQMFSALREHGVEAVDAVGQPFDPHLHEAVAHETADDVPEGTVVRQIRRGWKLRERLIRPATVVVAKAQSSAA